MVGRSNRANREVNPPERYSGGQLRMAGAFLWKVARIHAAASFATHPAPRHFAIGREVSWWRAPARIDDVAPL